MEWALDPLVITALLAGAVFGILFVRIFRKSRERGPDEKERETNSTLKAACRLSRDALLVVDPSQKILFANPAAQKLADLPTPLPLKETENTLEFFHEDEKKWLSLEGLLQKHRLRKGSESTLFKELIFDREKRMQVEVEIRTSRYEGSGSPKGYHVISIHDNSCEKKLFDLHHLNTLSGLPNQFKAYSDITAITAQSNDRNRFAVIMIELDDASRLRSMLGYAEMEKIITHISNVLREMRENPRVSIYHINYVNFMILLRQPNSVDEIHGLFGHFQLQVQESYNILQNKQKLTFSAGVSLYPNNTSLYSLIDNAYGALAQAQEEGRGHLVFASREMNQRLDHEILLNTEIEKGLRQRDFKLYFQPIYDTKDHRLAGAEVLLRWHHPEKGLMMPDTFIPIAEKSGLIIQIGTYVIEESLKLLSSWHSFGFPALQLSLNLSLRELESQEFINNLTGMLYKYETGDSRLKFEITEHTTMINPSIAHQKLKEIRQLGIGISLDDFGTGYSSFAHLAEFPIETLKIDRSFVTGMTRESGKRHIVSTITKLGHSLGMSIVAEGVESREEAILLGSYGVDYLQGYYFSRPLPQLEFQYLLSHS
jgi:EAL domain-containing protein (putative c-di-GMP-specific phosphodiesterase class I)/GGDEF domain-containing protein